MKSVFGIRLLFISVFLLFFLPAAGVAGEREHVEPYDSAWAFTIKAGLSSMLADEWFEKTQVGICVYDLTADSMVFSFNARQRMRPASTMKLLTAITALEELGGAYQFSTQLYYTGYVLDSVLYGDVYVVGGFDPRFGRDDMQAFVLAISSLAIDSVAGGVYADVSLKDTLQWGYGWCWDDEMPILTPLLYMEKDCFLEVMISRLRDAGISMATTGSRCCPAGAVRLCSRTHTIDQILMPMMKKSDNLYAEAVFYQLAVLGGIPFASYKEAGAVIGQLADILGVAPEEYEVADGSGVSLYNYLTPAAEVKFLRYAYKRQDIFRHLYNALPVAGRDGTLKNRMKHGSASKNVRAKTGTLTGVASLAGYLTASNGHRMAFCIINQGVDDARKARAFQDSVCEYLCR